MDVRVQVPPSAPVFSMFVKASIIARDDNPFDGMQALAIYFFRVFGAGWSSLVARRAHNPKVVSSNLAPATNFKKAPRCRGFLL